MQPHITPAVRELLRSRVTSMDHVEVLMALYAQRTADRSEAEIVSETRLGPDTVGKALAGLVRTGLVRAGASTGTYRYAADATDHETVETLATLYHQRPVSLVRVVYEQSPGPIISFADAFKLREGPK